VLRQLFILPSTIDRLKQGPLADYLEGYAEAQIQQGYRAHSIGRQVVAISDFSCWLERKRISLSELDELVGERFLRARRRHGGVRRGGPKALRRFLDLLRITGVTPLAVPPAPGAVAKEVADFRQYLLQDRRLSPSTALNYAPIVDRFLSERFRKEPLELSALRASDVTRFVVRKASQVSPLRAGLVVTALRSYFRYLRLRGAISVDLAACVPTVPSWSLSTLPSGSLLSTANLP